MKKKSVILIAILALTTIGGSVFAYVSFFAWNKEVWVEVVEPELCVYWDEECTTPVHGIDLGEVQVGARRKGVILYIRNEGEETLTLAWDSTIGSETDYKMGDNWFIWDPVVQGLEGTWIDPGQVFRTEYYIHDVSPDCPLGVARWTLYLGVRL